MIGYQHFFIVGAQRSGTTFLYKALDRHIEICMAKPIRPEPKYFLRKDNSGFNYDDYYKACFPHHSGQKYLGEKGTSYIEHPKKGIKIITIFPDAKIIIALRNPVDRAISNYFFSVNNGIENRTISEVFIDKLPHPKLAFPTSVSPFNYLKRGKYIEYIKEFTVPFEKEKVKIVFFEEFTSSFDVQKKIINFLGADTKNLSFYKESINASKKNQKVPYQIRNLLEEYYKIYNQQLSEYLNKDLSIWSLK
jgi:hypothetical protein